MRPAQFLPGLALALLAALPARADCPVPAAIDALAADILARRPATAPEVTTMADALCAQGLLVERLSAAWGAPAGYKAGLTSKPAQDAFGVTEPVRGVLFSAMFLPAGSRVPAAYGTVPRYESDLIATVASAEVNAATTPAEVLAALQSVTPFVELADLVVADPRSLTGPKITAINVGARLGVLGDPVPATAPGLLEALGSMTVTVAEAGGAVLAQAPGQAILGHPLNAVLWLRKAGVTFAPGDRISLGSFGPPMTPAAGQTVTVTWAGLPGDPQVTLGFD